MTNVLIKSIDGCSVALLLGYFMAETIRLPHQMRLVDSYLSGAVGPAAEALAGFFFDSAFEVGYEILSVLEKLCSTHPVFVSGGEYAFVF